MTSPLVSVIIPVYNTGQSAQALVKTLLSGTYPNLDLILVDDGSTDNSLAILKKLSSPKIRVVSQSNAGPSAARNAGLKAAKGKYICFIDSDDSVAPTYIKQLVGSISLPSTALAASPYLHRDLSAHQETPVGLHPPVQSARESRTTFILRLLLKGAPIYAVNNKIFHAQTIKSHQLRFDERLKFAEDTKFVLDYLKAQKGQIRFLSEPLYYYNFGTETSVVSTANANWANWQTSFASLQRWVGKTPSLQNHLLLRLIHLRWRLACLRSARALKIKQKAAQ